MLKKLICLFVLAVVSNAESVVLFSTNFAELPEGWVNGSSYSDEWLFSDAGANACGGTCDDYWSAVMYAPPGFCFVPDGTDSVVIHIEHFLEMSGEPSGEAKISLTSTTGDDVVIYWEGLPPSGGFYDSEPIHWSSGAFPEGTWIGLYFWPHLSTMWEMYNWLNWDLYSLTITAYGTGMAMNTVTWAAIKSSLE